MMKSNGMNGESPNIKRLRAIMDRFGKTAQKGLQIGVLGAALTAGTTLTTGCSPMTTDYGDAQTIETRNQADQPYDKVIAGGTYVFHNFMGEEPDIMASTATDDVNRYLAQGETYLQTQFAKFQQTLTDRPNLQRYFSQLTDPTIITDEKHHHHPHNYTANEKMDRIVNQISTACELIMSDIIANINNAEDQAATILCYRVLTNQAYKEGLWQNNENSNSMMKYNQERNEIAALWATNPRLKSVPLDRDIDSGNCTQTAGKLYTLLYYVPDNMQHHNSALTGIKLSDLQNVINLSLNARALEAMHDSTTELLDHQVCNMDLQITTAMEAAAGTTQTTDYDRTF